MSLSYQFVLLFAYMYYLIVYTEYIVRTSNDQGRISTKGLCMDIKGQRGAVGCTSDS